MVWRPTITKYARGWLAKVRLGSAKDPPRKNFVQFRFELSTADFRQIHTLCKVIDVGGGLKIEAGTNRVELWNRDAGMETKYPPSNQPNKCTTSTK